jgi:hypothetical protein
MAESSRCSAGTPAHFHWFGSTHSSGLSPRSQAARAFVESLDFPDGPGNAYLLAIALGEFHSRLDQAESGMLIGSTRVKRVRRHNDPPLFEIRWQGVAIPSVDTAETASVSIRMYHSEPANLPLVFIGHHIHKKQTTPTNAITALQDYEISVAQRICSSGKLVMWNVPLVFIDRTV